MKLILLLPSLWTKTIYANAENLDATHAHSRQAALQSWRCMERPFKQKVMMALRSECEHCILLEPSGGGPTEMSLTHGHAVSKM